MHICLGTSNKQYHHKIYKYTSSSSNVKFCPIFLLFFFLLVCMSRAMKTYIGFVLVLGEYSHVGNIGKRWLGHLVPLNRPVDLAPIQLPSAPSVSPPQLSCFPQQISEPQLWKSKKKKTLNFFQVIQISHH